MIVQQHGLLPPSWSTASALDFGDTVESEREVAQSCLTLCDPMGCSLPGFSIHGILRARILEWVTISFSRGSSTSRDWTRVSCIGGRRFTLWASREALVTPYFSPFPKNLMGFGFSFSLSLIDFSSVQYLSIGLCKASLLYHLLFKAMFSLVL